MIAPPDSTSDTMLDALAVTLGALSAASELDVDRTDDDRAFLAAEHKELMAHYNAVEAADQALRKHQHIVMKARQVAILIGDRVLDRGVRAGKARMKLELKNSAPDAVDHVFPTDINDIVGAEMRVEPQLVLESTAKFGQAPDFAGKDALKADLEGRANRQTKGFQARAEAEVAETALWGALDKAVAAGSDALYRLEKRMLDRFTRDKVYVKAFFLDVTPPRKKKGSEDAGGGEGGGAPKATPS
jgi:hypothetical protein